LVRRVLERRSHRPDHENLVPACAGAEQVSDELVRCQKPRDGFGVGSLVFVVFGVFAETYFWASVCSVYRTKS
jgi:hypothetical protein